MTEEVAQETQRSFEFPAEHMESLTGLLFVGRLTDTIRVFGHAVDIKTLTIGEMVRAGELVRPYMGTQSEQLAYKVSIVAACVERVDGEPLYTPISTKDDEMLGKFNVVRDWYPVVVDKVFGHYVQLEAVVKSVADSLGES